MRWQQVNINKCRRSDDTLFKMLVPENIKNITKSTFGNKMTNKHICYTNKKRIEINKKNDGTRI